MVALLRDDGAVSTAGSPYKMQSFGGRQTSIRETQTNEGWNPSAALKPRRCTSRFATPRVVRKRELPLAATVWKAPAQSTEPAGTTHSHDCPVAAAIRSKSAS